VINELNLCYLEISLATGRFVCIFKGDVDVLCRLTSFDVPLILWCKF